MKSASFIWQLALPILLCVALISCKEIEPPKRNTDLPRVMSINACADQLAYALADQEQIVSLSFYAKDRFSSPISEAAKKFPSNHGTAEEVLRLNPDIVFNSPFEKGAINDTIKSLGIKSYAFGVPQNVEEAVFMVQTAGYALRQSARANVLINQINQASMQSNKKPIRALLYFNGGFSAGKNTLVDDVMTRAGFENMAREYGVGNWGKIEIERVIANPPQMIIIADTLSKGSINGTRSQRIVRHQALFSKELNIKFAHFPNQYSYCGGPVIIDMAHHLKQLRTQYDEE